MQRFDKLVLLASLPVLGGWVLHPVGTLTSVALLAFGVAHVARLSRWQGHRTLSDPLVPAPQMLLKVLATAPRKSVFILTNHAGTGPWSYRGAADGMMKLRRRVGAEAFDIHSLRYTATAELARVGLDDDLIMSITGHKTHRMVQLYAGAERQKARARAANIARERNKDGMSLPL